MGFLKYADATVLVPSIDIEDWFRAKNPKFSARTANKAESILEEFDPKEYLLSHCTIIASVDTEAPANSKLGKIKVDGFVVDRQYPDFYVTADTSVYINGNADCWERNLLVASYPTFVGGENYVEHVQIPSLSKGKVIDAVARDLGDTIYIDILVATHKKHKDLIQDILRKKITTLSMGCEVVFTICTKCGNVAFDETQLCPHIKYEKGSTFIDPDGRERIVAELCGHKDVPDSVIFIEASWVKDPAFTGAVLHSILNPNIIDLEKISGLLKNAYESRRESVENDNLRRVASRIVLAQPPEDEEPAEDEAEDAPEEGGEEGGEGDWPDDSEGWDVEMDPVDEGLEIPGEGELTSYTDLMEEVRLKLLQDVWDTVLEEALEEPEPEITQFTEFEDDTLLESRKKRLSKNVNSGLENYRKFGWQSLKDKFSRLELLLVAKKAGIDFSFDEVKTLLKVGSISSYGDDPKVFLKKCQYIFNKSISNREIKRFILGGYILSLAKSRS